MALFRSERDQKDLKRRLDRFESMLLAIMDHLKIHYDPNAAVKHRASDEVRQLVRDGKKIEAIKLYRQETGADLAEAKDVVDSIA